jgi:hypothetical protein
VSTNDRVCRKPLTQYFSILPKKFQHFVNVSSVRYQFYNDTVPLAYVYRFVGAQRYNITRWRLRISIEFIFIIIIIIIITIVNETLQIFVGR